MALNANTLSTAIKTEIITNFGLNAAELPPKLSDFCDAVAKAVVNHIKSNAAVVGTCTNAAGEGTITGTVQ